MTMFDGYVAVDWSASATPTTVDAANNIWIAICNAHGTPELENHTTRERAMDYIETLLGEATKECRRLLCGFDFSFGYPKGTARMLTGRDGWEAVWTRISEVIEDCPNNRNNRFDAAAELNGCFGGAGPFWGNGLQRDVLGLLRTRPRCGWGENLPPRFRYAEGVVPRAQEVWKLNGAGSVGGQALTGIAALEGLRRRTDVQVWPFEETLGEVRSHVLAEIYPSLIDPCPGDDEVLDARQVKAVAEALQELDRLGELERHLRAPCDMPPCVRREEGAILGMQDQEGFRAAARVTPSC
jgi:precorrin-8X/cobalt-precorrin-8 methylmutase